MEPVGSLDPRYHVFLEMKYHLCPGCAHFKKDAFSGHLMAEMGFELKKKKLKPEAFPNFLQYKQHEASNYISNNMQLSTRSKQREPLKKIIQQENSTTV